MRLVESPYAGDVEWNLGYLRSAMADCFSRGEAPYASHGLYTHEDVLDDDNPAERALGIQAGLEWAAKADARVVYADLGVSDGMRQGIGHALLIGQPIEPRSIPGWVRS